MMRYPFFDLLILLTCLRCLIGGTSLVIEPKLWDYRGHEIGYEVSRRVITTDASSNNNINKTQIVFDDDDDDDDDNDKTKEPILLLNGFGVGSFHQHRLIPRLQELDSRIIYGVDYLGQGRSWPRHCDDGRSKTEKGLRYSADTWLDQLIRFIEEVVLPKHDVSSAGKGPTRVHLVGNSVGGHLAAHLANRRPDLIASICLLNPTPVWGFDLPGWNGYLPAPTVPKAIGRYLFNRIRDLTTIEKYLENAYARRSAFGKDLMQQIRGCTLGKGGHAAFASILFSPPLRLSADEKGDFQGCLTRVQCDVLLVFGQDDPWCKPAFGKKMSQALDLRGPDKVYRYVEIENCGHCPNHEAPQAVAKVVNSWVNAERRDDTNLSLVESEKDIFREPWGETILREKTPGDIELSWVDQLAVRFF